MTHRLNISPWIRAGEIVNTCLNQVHGWMQLAGMERPFYLNLTGNMNRDLAGRRVLFERDVATPLPIPSALRQRIATQQVGPSGMMTRADDTLALEWHSQDGHFFATFDAKEIDVSPAVSDLTSDVLKSNTLPSRAAIPNGEAEWLCDGLFASMPSLQTLSPAVRHESIEDQFALLDSILDHQESEVPLHYLLSSSLNTPQPQKLSGIELQLKVKEILANLAMLGVTLDVCHHFTVEQTYRLLHKLIKQEKLHPQSAVSGYIIHYMTFEHCEICLEEEETWVHDIEAEEAKKLSAPMAHPTPNPSSRGLS